MPAIYSPASSSTARRIPRHSRPSSFPCSVRPRVARRAHRFARTGELVELLWRDGLHPAAIALETLWNRAAQKLAFSLLCAYRIDNDPRLQREVLGVRTAHDDVACETGGPAQDAAREVGFSRAARPCAREQYRQRARLEEALRDALAERERLLVEVESDRARLERSEERQVVQRRRLELLQVLITATFARALDPVAIAAIVVHEGTTALGAPGGGLWLLGDGGKTLDLVRSNRPLPRRRAGALLSAA